MKIIQLNISEFGGIKNRVIDLDGGFNIIGGANESGKSTVMLFIRFMLYGLPKKGSRTSERDRALSFDGKRAQGSMLVTHEGRTIRIERRAVLSGVRVSESLNITDTATGESLEGEAGQIFFGVPAEVFESSCSISQMRAADIGGDKAMTAIENMLVSADESIDMGRVLSALDKVRKEYRLNRGEGGIIYDTEQEISRLRQKLREATEKHLRYNEMSGKLARTEKNLEKVTEAHRQSSGKLEQINGGIVLRQFEELDAKLHERELVRKELDSLEAENKTGEFIPTESHASELKGARLALNEASVKAALRRRELEGLPSLEEEKMPLANIGGRIKEAGGKAAYIEPVQALNKKAKSKRTLSFASLVGGLISLAFGGVLFTAALPVAVVLLILGAAALSFGCVVLASAKGLAAKRDSKSLELGAAYGELEAYAESCLEAHSRLESMEARSYAATALLHSAEEEVKEKYKRLVELLKMTAEISNKEKKNTIDICRAEEQRIAMFCQKRAELTRQIYALDMLISNTQKELGLYDREALLKAVEIPLDSLTPENIEKAKMAERFDSQRKDLLQKETANLREALAALGGGLGENPTHIADKIKVLEEKLNEHTKYYDALMLAKTRLEEASTSMSGNVTPVIGQKASELLSLVSNGAHSSLQTSKNLDVSVEQDGFHIKAELLSGGTRDAAYICLRISLMLRLFDTELPPLIMDESLCQLDDSRAANMLTLLSRLSTDTTQCILLTCHKREEQLCHSLGIAVNAISMD